MVWETVLMMPDQILFLDLRGRQTTASEQGCDAVGAGHGHGGHRFGDLVTHHVLMTKVVLGQKTVDPEFELGLGLVRHHVAIM